MAEAIEIVVDDTERGSRTLEEGKSGQPIGLCESALLVFEDISYRVPRPEGGKKEILSKVSGACRPGRLTALMGASGNLPLRLWANKPWMVIDLPVNT